RALVGARDGRGHVLELPRALGEGDLVADAHRVARDVEALAVHVDVAVPHELPALRARGRDAEAALQQREHLLAGAPLATVRLLEIPLELALEHAVDAPHLLLLTEAHCVLAELDAPL